MKRRSWISRLSLGAVVLLASAGVFAAARADGLSASEVDSSDGGAWLVNGREGVVGHVNRAVMELSGSTVLVGDPDSDLWASQSRDVVVVHDRTTANVVLVDDRLARPANSVAVSASAEAFAVPGGVVISDGPTGKVWWVERVRFSEMESIDDEEPVIEADAPVAVSVDRYGTTHVVATTDLAAWSIAPETGVVTSRDLLTDPAAAVPQPAGPAALSAIGDRFVLADPKGSRIVLDRGSSADVFALSAEWSTAVLQQPSVDADRVVGVSLQGVVLEMDSDDGSEAVPVPLAGVDPLPPVVHKGCVYVVTRQPAALHRLCRDRDGVDSRPLSGAGQNLRLRLVNGWVWINDAMQGTVWVAPPEGDLGRVDDWGVALGTTQLEVKEGTLEGDAPLQEELVDDPDAANAEVVSGDFQLDEDGVNDPPVARDDLAATRPDRPAIIDVLDNDEDADGDVLMVTAVGSVDPERGSVQITADRSAVQFTPAPGLRRVEPLSPTRSTTAGGPPPRPRSRSRSSRRTSTAPPVATTDVAATRAGSPVTINVLLNDFDPEGDSLVLLDARAEEGRVSFTSDGKVVFSPVVDITQTRVEAAYTVADEFGATAEGTLIVAVRPANSNNEPDARNDRAVGVVGAPITFNVLDNDSDPDGDALTVIRPPDDARIKLTADGEVFFRPDEPGTVLFTYVVSDGGESDSARVRIEVEPRRDNRPPVAVRDDVALPRGGTGMVFPLQNDGDPDGDVVGIDLWVAPPGLSVEVLDGRSFRLKVALNAPGSMTLLYAITDGRSDRVWSTVVITVIDAATINQAPLPGQRLCRGATRSADARGRAGERHRPRGRRAPPRRRRLGPGGAGRDRG
jgi:large repetitive protein